MSSDAPHDEGLRPLTGGTGPTSRPERVIRPSAAGAMLDRRFRLEDISALTEALLRASQGRIERLRGTAQVVEERLRSQVEASRAQISRAIEAAEREIELRVQDTTRRAELTIENAYREGREQGERDGFEKGYAEGLEKGLREGRERALEETRAALAERTETVVPALEALVEEFAREKRTLREDAQRDLIALAIEVARRIVRREVEAAPPVIVETLHAAIDRIDSRRGLVIELHPDDRAAAEEYLARLYGKVEAEQAITIVEHPERSRGGCRVRTECGSVDETIETQFDLVEQRLLGREEVHG